VDSKNFDCQIYVCVYKQQYQYESNVRYPKILQYHYNNFKTWAKSLVPHGFNFDTVSHRSCQQSMGPSQKPTELGTDFTSRGKKGLNPALQPNGNDWKQELCISRTIETNVNNQPFLMNGDEPFCAQFVNFLPMSHVWNSMNGWIERRPTLGSHMGSRRKYMLSCSSPFRFPWFGIHTHSFFTTKKGKHSKIAQVNGFSWTVLVFSQHVSQCSSNWASDPTSFLPWHTFSMETCSPKKTEINLTCTLWWLVWIGSGWVYGWKDLEVSVVQLRAEDPASRWVSLPADCSKILFQAWQKVITLYSFRNNSGSAQCHSTAKTIHIRHIRLRLLSNLAACFRIVGQTDEAGLQHSANFERYLGSREGLNARSQLVQIKVTKKEGFVAATRNLQLISKVEDWQKS